MKFDVDEAMIILEANVERDEADGSYWEDEVTGEKITSRECFEMVKAELARLRGASCDQPS